MVKHPKTFISGGSRWKVVYTSPDKEKVFKARNMYKEDKFTRLKKLSNGWWAIGVKPK